MDQQQEKVRQFAAYGVKENEIFREIMRARHLDYVLFSRPENRANREYGLSQEELYEAAQKLTAETLGPAPGPAETYAAVYTLALSVDPMDFSGAEAPSRASAAVLREAVGQAEKAGQTVLFAGADRYLARLTDIFVTLRDKRIAVAVDNASWRQPLSLIYGRGRIMTMDEIPADEERYDYIFYFGAEEERTLALWQAMEAHLAEDGVMEALLPSALLRADEGPAKETLSAMAARRTVSSMYHLVDGEAEEDLIASGGADRDGHIRFGELDCTDGLRRWNRAAISREAFAGADSWDYDLYGWNGSEAVQTILAAGLLDPDFAVGSVFRAVPALKGTLGTYRVIPAEAVTDACVREDLVKEQTAADVKRVEAGDLLAVRRPGGIRCAVVPDRLAGAAAAADVMVFRPMDSYTAEYLKVYLDGPLGGLFLGAMTAGGTCHVCASRLLRLPVRRASEAQIGALTAMVRKSTAALAAAEDDWRRVKRDAVGLLMGR